MSAKQVTDEQRERILRLREKGQLLSQIARNTGLSIDVVCKVVILDYDAAEKRRQRFTWERGDVITSQCMACVHARRGPHCDAYPGPLPIPKKIEENEHDHRKPYPNDQGIRFEQDPKCLPVDFRPFSTRYV
jgi:hypothetical protein